MIVSKGLRFFEEQKKSYNFSKNHKKIIHLLLTLFYLQNRLQSLLVN
jgi:hypothetical protein